MEFRIFVVALRQVVVRDFGAQVVDVMEPDVSAEPLQDKRQLIEGTAL